MNLQPSFLAPSGRRLSRYDINLWQRLETLGTIGWNDEEVVFNSGFRSHIYFSGRNELSDHPGDLLRVCSAIKDVADHLPFTHGPQHCLIGIPTAGTQLAQGVSHLTMQGMRQRPPMAFRTMRLVPKDHGKQKSWVGPPHLERHSYLTVENIISTAKAMLDAFGKLASEGYPVKEMHHISFASWELGGRAALEAEGYKLRVLYLIPDIVAMLCHTGVWPQERYEDMQQRLAAARPA